MHAWPPTQVSRRSMCLRPPPSLHIMPHHIKTIDLMHACMHDRQRRCQGAPCACVHLPVRHHVAPHRDHAGADGSRRQGLAAGAVMNGSGCIPPTCTSRSCWHRQQQMAGPGSRCGDEWLRLHTTDMHISSCWHRQQQMAGPGSSCGDEWLRLHTACTSRSC